MAENPIYDRIVAEKFVIGRRCGDHAHLPQAVIDAHTDWKAVAMLALEGSDEVWVWLAKFREN